MLERSYSYRYGSVSQEIRLNLPKRIVNFDFNVVASRFVSRGLVRIATDLVVYRNRIWWREKRMQSTWNIGKADFLRVENLSQVLIKVDPDSVIWILKILSVFCE